MDHVGKFQNLCTKLQNSLIPSPTFLVGLYQDKWGGGDGKCWPIPGQVGGGDGKCWPIPGQVGGGDGKCWPIPGQCKWGKVMGSAGLYQDKWGGGDGKCWPIPGQVGEGDGKCWPIYFHVTDVMSCTCVYVHVYKIKL